MLPGSVNRRAYDKAREMGITVYSDATLAEFASTLTRHKFDKYISLEKRIEEIDTFERLGQLIHVSITLTNCRDPNDNKFLELAVEAGATCLITGDKDLLVLNPFRQIPILTASEFIAQF